jgi:predicted Zn-dependent protease/tRNA A-37 threonylcarbamoyl transferase component Bud32
VSAAAEVLAGRYEVGAELARGGMGRVVRARDRLLDREVAIKLILGGKNASMEARFIEESQITGQLAHPNIIPVHELGEHAGEAFLVMKLVRGETLKKVAQLLEEKDKRARREFARPRLLRLFLKVCDALAHAHARGVIHRDLKPANVMVGDGDEVLVMDWGLAKPYEGAAEGKDAVRSLVRELAPQPVPGEDGETGSQLTGAGQVLGTPAYMPPEQVSDASRLDPRADVYSLGAILYELLTLRPPYEGGGLQVLAAVVRRPPPSPREVAREAIPPPLEAIVLKAMARDPAARYPDARALAEDVARFVDGDAVAAYRETAREALRRLFARHRAVVVTLALALVAVQVAVVGWVVVVGQQSARRRESTAQAEAAAARADAGRAKAAEAAANAAAATRALELAGRSVVIASEFERRCKTLLPLDPEAGTSGLPGLHAQARETLEDLRAQVARQGDARAVAKFVDEVDLALRTIGAAYVEALLARAPSRVAALLDAQPPVVPLGAGERALSRARALVRLGRQAEATQALVAAGASTGKGGAALLAYLRRATPDEVEASFAAAIEESPDRAWLFLRRAEARVRAGRLDDAVVDYERAASLSRLDAWIYSSRIATTVPAFSTDTFGGLIGQTANFVKELSPENVDADHLTPMSELWMNDRWDEWLKLVEGVRARDVARATRLGAEGALLTQRWDDAERFAREALQAAPGDPFALCCLAEVELARERGPDAERLAREGLAAAPGDGRLSTALGRALLAQGRAREAIPPLELGARGAVTSDPWRYLAEACARVGDSLHRAKAIEAARHGLTHDPYDVSYYHARARPVAGDPRLHRLIGQMHLLDQRPAAAALHFLRAYVMASSRAQGALGDDRQDALHLGDAHAAMGLVNEALNYYAMASDDPKLKVEADRRSQRLIEEFERNRGR